MHVYEENAPGYMVGGTVLSEMERKGIEFGMFELVGTRPPSSYKLPPPPDPEVIYIYI